MRIDLHNHTNYSDGVLTPNELVDLAIKKGVDIFALTDHDSVFGCDEIQSYAKLKGIKVIKGLELSTSYKGESVHIICLFKNNIVPKEMYDFSLEYVEKRKERAITMMNNIHDIYKLNINIDELIEESTIITRANMLRHIAKYNNMTLDEARFYVSKESRAYVSSTKMTVIEGLDLARKSNCFCIFAHPCLIKNQVYVEEILKFGFDGIEVRYPSNKNNEKYLKKLAKKYNLKISAGSDCHGDSTHALIGDCTLNEKEFLPIAKEIGFEIEVK